MPPAYQHGMQRAAPSSLLSVLVALALVWAGVAQAASALPMARMDGQVAVVICGSDGPETVVLPADAAPGGAAPGHDCRLCPDCLLGALADTSAAPRLTTFVPMTRAALPVPHPVQVGPRLHHRQQARAPPTKA